MGFSEWSAVMKKVAEREGERESKTRALDFGENSET